MARWPAVGGRAVAFRGGSPRAVLMLGRIVRLALAAVGLIGVALVGRGVQVVRRAGGDPARVVRRHGGVRVGELRVRLAAHRARDGERPLVAHRDVAARGRHRELEGSVQRGCRRAAEYSYMVRGGEEPARTAARLVAASMLTTTALLGLAALCVPLRFPSREPRCSSRAGRWLGTGAIVVLLLLGFTAFTTDGCSPRWRGEPGGCSTGAAAPAAVRRPCRAGARERDRVRHALGSRWPWAVVAVVSRWAFDYFARGCRRGERRRIMGWVVLAYITASVLKMVPITPGGLGFVEAGLAVALVWAGPPPRTRQWPRSRTGSCRTRCPSSRASPQRSSTATGTRPGLVPRRPDTARVVDPGARLRTVRRATCDVRSRLASTRRCRSAAIPLAQPSAFCGCVRCGGGDPA